MPYESTCLKNKTAAMEKIIQHCQT